MNTKVVLITGASSGIGLSVALYLQKHHYKVYGTSRNPSAYPNSKFPLLAMNLNDVNSILQTVSEVMIKEGRIDVLINNAGAGITGPIEEIPTEEILKNFQTNLFGPIEVIKAVLPHMRKQRDGLIINVTSIAGYMGLPYRGIYSASKGALELITETLSMEVKQFGINVVSVAPGDFATNIAQGRYHSPLHIDSEYNESYGLTLKLMDQHVDEGDDPIMMAQAIHQIISDKSPKIHYKVGAYLQKFSIILKRLLPDRVYERMLMNHYKL